MPIITLPDGSQQHFAQPLSVAEVAATISAGLAKAALAAKINGQLVDTSFIIQEDAYLSLLTDRDPESLEIIRHSCAHLLAQAVKILFPETQVTIGPVIENGFYYDFSRKEPFSTSDLEKIQSKMEELIAADLQIKRFELPRDEAIQFFKNLGEHYKAEIIASIPNHEKISLYQQGDFTDLCRGPHLPSTGKIKAFKLMKVAGAYWRGNAKNEMLQRIYGTAWLNKKDLDAYLHKLEQAEQRDHRKLGKNLDLFHFQEEAPGMVFWHSKGWTIYQQIENYMRKVFRENGYQEVHTPQVVDRSLWEKSGHWDKFREEMFTTKSEERDYAVKPMNCPCHIQIYNQGIKSYRDLPLRLAEFGSCHRNEPSGALHGLLRVRNFVQDDAHIFCTEDQIQSEVATFIDLLYKVYADFGFKNILIKLSTRPAQRVGSDEVWDKAEQALQLALTQKNLQWQLQPGEGAFYGPKIEFSLKDSLDRIWQCGTIQVDFSMPNRLGAEYVASDGSRQTPVMLHRAILGSLERFIGILIEEYAGAFPFWLAPVQAVVLPITSAQHEYAQQLTKQLKEAGFRIEMDLRNEKINLKIREHTLQKVPYLLVVGKRESEQKTVAVRTRKGEDIGVISIEQLIENFKHPH